MGLRETLRGWLGQAPAADKGLDKAAEDESEREYSAQKADRLGGSRLGAGHDQFEADERGPGR
jgi:hypothetical protein